MDSCVKLNGHDIVASTTVPPSMNLRLFMPTLKFGQEISIHTLESTELGNPEFNAGENVHS